MSARDEAIEAGHRSIVANHMDGVEAGVTTFYQPSEWPTALATDVLDAAHASGAIVYADELEQVGCRTIRKADLEKWYVSSGPVWRYEQGMIDGDSPEFIVERLFRKRPQEPNE